jgi:phosphoglycolate phosphatase-like HAD superfamily hydrolase
MHTVVGKRGKGIQVRKITTVLWDVGGTLLKYAMSGEEFISGRLAAAGIPAGSLSGDSFLRAERFRSWRVIAL